MHLRALLLSAFVLSLAAVASAGDVLVYRGTYRETQPGDTAKVLVGKCFVVFGLPATNQTAGQIGFVFYYVQPTGPDKGTKVVLAIPAKEARFGGVTEPNGKVLRTISHAESAVSEPTFAEVGHHFRGVQVPIPIRPNGQNPPITVNEPARLVGGSFSNAATFLGSKYFEHVFSLKQDVQKTLEANAANRSVTDTVTDLVAYVKTLGYQTQ